MAKINLLLRVPLFLTILRAALAPAMIAIAQTTRSSMAFGFCLFIALLSDIYDGKIARRLGVATPNLRRLDSIADSIFYVAAIYCVWSLHRAVIMDNLTPLLALLVLELGRYAFDFLKFGKEASYHMWSSKLWGLFLFLAFFSVLVLGKVGLQVWAAIYWGMWADAEGLLISIVLPYWKNDVPTLLHALKIRKQFLLSQASRAPI